MTRRGVGDVENEESCGGGLIFGCVLKSSRYIRTPDNHLFGYASLFAIAKHKDSLLQRK
jgi:hypothetical protein